MSDAEPSSENKVSFSFPQQEGYDPETPSSRAKTLGADSHSRSLKAVKLQGTATPVFSGWVKRPGPYFSSVDRWCVLTVNPPTLHFYADQLESEVMGEPVNLHSMHVDSAQTRVTIKKDKAVVIKLKLPSQQEAERTRTRTHTPAPNLLPAARHPPAPAPTPTPTPTPDHTHARPPPPPPPRKLRRGPTDWRSRWNLRSKLLPQAPQTARCLDFCPASCLPNHEDPRSNRRGVPILSYSFRALLLESPLKGALPVWWPVTLTLQASQPTSPTSSCHHLRRSRTF